MTSVQSHPGHRAACRLLLIAGLASTVVGRVMAAGTGDPATFERTIQPFLKSYCVECHGPRQQKGERRFDVLKGEIRDDDTLVDYQDILDQSNLGSMPPR